MNSDQTLELLEKCLRLEGSQIQFDTENIPDRDREGRSLGVKDGGIRVRIPSQRRGWDYHIAPTLAEAIE